MDDHFLNLIAALHLPQHRQGPGSEKASRTALALTGLINQQNLTIADIGCGTGASAMFLAEALDAQITAIDFLPAFVNETNKRAANANLDSRITAVTGDMTALELAPESLDLIWSEGAIYNMGFEEGIHAWKKFLKPGGVIAVSDLTWTSADRPNEITEFWQNAYPGVDLMSAKTAQLEKAGYSPLGAFLLPENCWVEEYFAPLQANIPTFLENHSDDKIAETIAKEQLDEIALYEKYGAYFSYGFFIAQKLA